MERADKDLAFMLRYENVAWYSDGEVRILDRRIYPAKTEFVRCASYEDVIFALRDMVTQSTGPYTAAGAAMALAAFQCRDKTKEKQLEFLTKASQDIANARPTTVKRMALITEECLCAAKKAIEEEKDVSAAINSRLTELNNIRYNKVYAMAKYLCCKIPKSGGVMTQCFGETIVGQMCRVLKETGKEDVRVFCPETRPYFQGARLTATVCRDMGLDVTVITDNMPACVMKKENVSVFTSAADAICMDGSVINKIGTYQIAIAARYHGIPYYVTGAPDRMHVSARDVQIEQRDPEFSLQAMGVRTAASGVKGYYPAFDVTPPELVCGVVTDRGIFDPVSLETYFLPDDKPELVI
ncbi:MAG: s-methyl-5-thioribose-1-phosphate isomerase [Clostridia bacterium]|nr:s-methyl-5-thioribose-1-phosphate isomerase [Clostridia bacterium]